MPHVRGTQHPRHKLTEQAVREIRRAYAPGRTTYRQIAAEYGVSLQLIGRVVSRTAWAWVQDQ